MFFVQSPCPASVKHARSDQIGADNRDVNASFTRHIQFIAKGFCKTYNAKFTCTIVGKSRYADQPRTAGDGDNMALIARQHIW